MYWIFHISGKFAFWLTWIFYASKFLLDTKSQAALFYSRYCLHIIIKHYHPRSHATDCRQSQADSSTFEAEIYVILWRIQDFILNIHTRKRSQRHDFYCPRPNNLAVNTATYMNIETAQNNSCKATLLQRNGWLKEEESTGGINPSKCSSNRNWFLTTEGLG